MNITPEDVYRIIGEHGTNADRNRVDAGTHAMNFAAGIGSGEPLPSAAAIARRAGDRAIERGCKLEDDPGSLGTIEERGVELPGSVSLQADVDHDSGVAQPCTSSGGDRVRIFARGDDARDAGGDDGVRTGRRLAVVGAGLEGHIECGASRAVAGVAQRANLGVVFAVAGVKSLAHDNIVLHDDGADHRIRRRLSPTAAGEVERPPHVRALDLVVRQKADPSLRSG